MQKTRINNQIKAPKIRLISSDGEQLGIVSLSDALKVSEEHGLDIVEVSPNAKPPVVKLISYDKYKYQQKKLESQQKKKVKKVEVKTVRISAKIAIGDIITKAKRADKFLEDGDWVKIELRMKGREQAFVDVARKQMETFKDSLTVPYRIEVPPKRAGSALSTTVAPVK